MPVKKLRAFVSEQEVSWGLAKKEITQCYHELEELVKCTPKVEANVSSLLKNPI